MICAIDGNIRYTVSTTDIYYVYYKGYHDGNKIPGIKWLWSELAKSLWYEIFDSNS